MIEELWYLYVCLSVLYDQINQQHSLPIPTVQVWKALSHTAYRILSQANKQTNSTSPQSS